MGSKRENEEVIPSECGEYPPKKMKMDSSLLLEVQNGNLTKLKFLVKQGVDVKIPGNFSLSEQQRFVDVPALFAATISDRLAIIEYLVGKHPHFPIVRKQEKTRDPDCPMLPTYTDAEYSIEVLELVGAACIFRGNTDARKHGWSCWNQAIKLREGNGLPKPTLPQSEWEKLALRGKREFQNAEELNKLFRQRRMHWKTQAFFISQRILKKYNLFPNKFVVYNFFQFALLHWESRNLTPPRAFAISLYLIELFGTTTFLDQLVRDPTKSNDVVHATLTEFSKTLRNPQWNQPNLTEPDPVLTFDHLMTSLVFSFEYQVKVHDHGQDDQIVINPVLTIKPKSVKLEETSELILLILQQLVSMPKSETQSKKLKSQLQTFIITNENKWINQKPNLLLKACALYQGKTEEFKLIKFLLEAGGNPNAVDQHRRSPLHLLANKEVVSSTMWSSPSYPTRAEYYTSIVRVILDGRFHEDQVDLDGKSALECIKSSVIQYPNAQLRQLLGNFLQGVRPLSCTAAKVARRHRLPCECLPVALQYMVLQH